MFYSLKHFFKNGGQRWTVQFTPKFRMANYSQPHPCSCMNPTADSESVDTCGSLWKYAMTAVFLLFTVQPTATLSSEETELEEEL